MVEIVCTHKVETHGKNTLKDVVYSGETLDEVYLKIGKQKRQWSKCSAWIECKDPKENEAFLDWLFPEDKNVLNYVRCGFSMN